EHLIVDLIVKLSERRKAETDKVLKSNTQTDREFILLASGKIYELDEVIGFLEDMLLYHQRTKKITQGNERFSPNFKI
ncbi:MAG: hypothetical protein NTY32_04125, partial [Bacteroidia bacterium]|nr:hypothetical protein [Bacteroidia bacterium]